MDRQIVYPGAIPLDTDLLFSERSAMIGLGYLAQAVLGTSTLVDGLQCLPTQPASMVVVITPGCVTQFGSVDSQPFGGLGAAPTEPLVKIGINLTNTSFTLTAPPTPGYAVDYLIEASFLEADAVPVVLPYYNAANPSQPFSGPNNDGAAQNTQRLQSVQLQLKAGTPNVSGSQTPPTADAGWVGLYSITVSAGQVSLTNANIAVLPTAPFVNWKLPQLTPGTHQLAAFTPTSQGSWQVPSGVTSVKVRAWGGGGAGGAGFGGAGGGGAGGGYVEGFLTVVPGQAVAVAVGNGGTGSGGKGGTSSFGTMAAATGGQAGASGSSGGAGAGGTTGGAGSGGELNIGGQAGAGAFGDGTNWMSGRGGAAFGGAGAEPVIALSTASLDGHSALLPGVGGGGGIGSGLGGQGGPGLVLVEW